MQSDPADSTGNAAVNPTAILEVLSPGTEQFDRARKFQQYLRLESLREYVLISQDFARVETFYRQTDGTWLFTPIDGIESAVRLHSLDLELPLREIYEGVEFPPEEQLVP